MKKTAKKRKRPNIPPKTQLRLWVIAGGRCEFPGCNEFLLHDKLTLSAGNYSNIAHIISWTLTGPRGDKILSPKLATDISNLMLMCQMHSKAIDLKNNLTTYTVEYLRKCKTDHENRIHIQTNIDVSRKTTVVRLQTNIRGRRVELSQSDAYNALIVAGRYPKDEKGILIDLTNINYSPDKSSWETAMKQIDNILSQSLIIGNDEKKDTHFSIFGIAPIPILVYLGFKLGNTIPADTYIKLREKPWSITSSKQKLYLAISKSSKKEKAKDVGLSIAISGTTLKTEISKHIKNSPVYEIKPKKSGIDQIKCIEDLEEFRKTYRKVIDEIREKHGKCCKIHLFGAMPTCASVICGREILHGVDPSIIMYEHMGQEDGLVPVLTIN